MLAQNTIRDTQNTFNSFLSFTVYIKLSFTYGTDIKLEWFLSSNCSLWVVNTITGTSTFILHLDDFELSLFILTGVTVV